MDLTAHISPNFTWREVIASQAATQPPSLIHLQNDPPEAICGNLQRLVCDVLQPARDALATSIFVTSGYRCPALNRRVGGAPNSRHLRGLAADIMLSPSFLSGSAAMRRHDLRARIMSETKLPVRENAGATFYLFALLVLEADALGVGGLIHERGTPGSPTWVHVDLRDCKPRFYSIGAFTDGAYELPSVRDALMLGCTTTSRGRDTI